MIGLTDSAAGLGFSLTGTEVAVSAEVVLSIIAGWGLSVGIVVGSEVPPHATSSNMDVKRMEIFMNGRLVDNVILFKSELLRISILRSCFERFSTLN